GAGDRLLEVGDLAGPEAEVRARQQTLRRGRERRVETVRDALGAQAAVLRPRRLGIQAPARLDPGEELAGGEAPLEDPPLREHAAVEHRRHTLESPARTTADDAGLALPGAAFEGADEVALEVVVPGGHLGDRRASRRLLHQP